MSSRRADKHKRGIHRRFSFDSCRFDIYTDTFMQSPARAPGRKVGLCKGKFNYEEFFHLLGTFNSVMSTCIRVRSLGTCTVMINVDSNDDSFSLLVLDNTTANTFLSPRCHARLFDGGRFGNPPIVQYISTVFLPFFRQHDDNHNKQFR